MTTAATPEPAAPTRNTAPPTPPDKQFSIIPLLAKLGPLIGLLLVFALFSILRGEKFYNTANVSTIFQQTVVVAITALGMTMIIVSGGIDLSVGSTIAVVTVVVAKLMNAGASPSIAALGGVGTGAVAGLVVGLLITRLKLAPFIVTLGAWGAYRGIAKGIADNQTVNTAALPDWMTSLLTLPYGSRWMLVPIGVYITLVLAVLMVLVLRYTRFGRHVFAVGSNENTARLCGVHVDRTKVLIYIFAGLLTGIAGVMEFTYISQGDPTTASGRELDVIAAVVIGGASLSGGQGTILGTIIGAVFMTTIANGCTKMGWENWVQEIATGGIIVLAAALDRLRHRRT